MRRMAKVIKLVLIQYFLKDKMTCNAASIRNIRMPHQRRFILTYKWLQLIRGQARWAEERRNKSLKIQKARFQQFYISKSSSTLAFWSNLTKNSLNLHEQVWIKITRLAFPTDPTFKKGQLRLTAFSWFTFNCSDSSQSSILSNNLLQILINLSCQATQLHFLTRQNATKVFFDIFYAYYKKNSLTNCLLMIYNFSHSVQYSERLVGRLQEKEKVFLFFSGLQS